MPGLLAVVGDLVEDVVVWPAGPVQRGSDTPARVFRPRGGSATNVAAAAFVLERLGRRRPEPDLVQGSSAVPVVPERMQ